MAIVFSRRVCVEVSSVIGASAVEQNGQQIDLFEDVDERSLVSRAKLDEIFVR